MLSWSLLRPGRAFHPLPERGTPLFQEAMTLKVKRYHEQAKLGGAHSQEQEEK
jgi:hypothetical protein